MPERWPCRISRHARPVAGESECGDASLVWHGEGRVVLALADGLGHGPEAAVAAQGALRCVALNAWCDCETIFQRCDEALRCTRGVAMALALIDTATARAQLASVGNVRTLLLSTQGRDRRYAGARGIVGGGYGCLAPETIALQAGDVLALYSDGLDELLPLRECLARAGDFEHSAAAVLRQWALPRDDAAMLLLRCP